MKVMVLVKGDERYEGGQMPSTEELAEMSEFNEQLANAGIMLAGEGLHPSSKAARIQYPDRKVVDGPFAESKELLAGYWLLQVKSLDEAVEWMKRAPFKEGEIEIRQVFEEDDFGDELTPEIREKEQRIREQVEGRQ
jgi:hypothetical protein